jgi:hypothetical protein
MGAAFLGANRIPCDRKIRKQEFEVEEKKSKMVSRRQFVKQVGLGALAGSGISVVGAHVAAAVPMDNAEKSAEARLIPGCCAYSYNEDLRHGTMTLEDFILKAKDLRVLAVDMTGYYLKSTEQGYLHGLRNLAYRHGVAFSGAACGVSMVQADAVSRAESLKQINKWVDVTDTLGASHLRIFAGNLPPGSRLKDAIDWVVETMTILNPR